eukprot:953581-Pyramimonas_sp.AAC.1
MPVVLRTLGGSTGTYADFHEYAKDYWVQQLMEGYLRSVQAGGSGTIWDQAVVATSVLQPHANYNTGIMWLFATA